MGIKKNKNQQMSDLEIQRQVDMAHDKGLIEKKAPLISKDNTKWDSADQHFVPAESKEIEGESDADRAVRLQSEKLAAMEPKKKKEKLIKKDATRWDSADQHNIAGSK